MLSPEERLSRFLENKIAKLKEQNSRTCFETSNSTENEQFNMIASAFGVERLLDYAAVSEDEEMDESFLEVKRPITVQYLRATGLLSFENLVAKEYNFNFQDLNNYINKL